MSSPAMDNNLKWAIVLACVLLVKASQNQGDSHRQNEINSDEQRDDISDNLKVLTRLISDCGEQEDTSVCFKMKAVSFLERLIKAPSDVPITDFMALARDPSAPPMDSSSPATEQELDATLPRSLEEKSKKLDDLLWNKFVTLLNTRKLTLSVPNEDSIEGRGKGGGHMKGKKGHMMMMMMMKGMIMKMMMWGMAAMSWKGMMMAKMAMVMAGWMMMKKMAEHPPAPAAMYGPPPEQPMGGGGYYRRHQTDAQNMAYGGSQPTIDY